jgi:hypothetical protein
MRACEARVRNLEKRLDREERKIFRIEDLLAVLQRLSPEEHEEFERLLRERREGKSS